MTEYVISLGFWEFILLLAYAITLLIFPKQVFRIIFGMFIIIAILIKLGF